MRRRHETLRELAFDAAVTVATGALGKAAKASRAGLAALTGANSAQTAARAYDKAMRDGLFDAARKDGVNLADGKALGGWVAGNPQAVADVRSKALGQAFGAAVGTALGATAGKAVADNVPGFDGEVLGVAVDQGIQGLVDILGEDL